MKVSMTPGEKTKMFFDGLKEPGPNGSKMLSRDVCLYYNQGTFVLRYKSFALAVQDESSGHIKTYSIKNAFDGNVEEQVEAAAAYKFLSFIAPFNVRVHENIVVVATRQTNGLIFLNCPGFLVTNICYPTPTKKEILEYRKLKLKQHIDILNATGIDLDSDGRPA